MLKGLLGFLAILFSIYITYKISKATFNFLDKWIARLQGSITSGLNTPGLSGVNGAISLGDKSLRQALKNSGDLSMDMIRNSARGVASTLQRNQQSLDNSEQEKKLHSKEIKERAFIQAQEEVEASTIRKPVIPVKTDEDLSIRERPLDDIINPESHQSNTLSDILRVKEENNTNNLRDFFKTNENEDGVNFREKENLRLLESLLGNSLQNITKGNSDYVSIGLGDKTKMFNRQALANMDNVELNKVLDFVNKVSEEKKGEISDSLSHFGSKEGTLAAEQALGSITFEPKQVETDINAILSDKVSDDNITIELPNVTAIGTSDTEQINDSSKLTSELQKNDNLEQLPSTNKLDTSDSILPDTTKLELDQLSIPNSDNNLSTNKLDISNPTLPDTTKLELDQLSTTNSDNNLSNSKLNTNTTNPELPLNIEDSNTNELLNLERHKETLTRGILEHTKDTLLSNSDSNDIVSGPKSDITVDKIPSKIEMIDKDSIDTKSIELESITDSKKNDNVKLNTSTKDSTISINKQNDMIELPELDLDSLSRPADQIPELKTSNIPLSTPVESKPTPEEIALKQQQLRDQERQKELQEQLKTQLRNNPIVDELKITIDQQTNSLIQSNKQLLDEFRNIASIQQKELLKEKLISEGLNEVVVNSVLSSNQDELKEGLQTLVQEKLKSGLEEGKSITSLGDYINDSTKVITDQLQQVGTTISNSIDLDTIKTENARLEQEKKLELQREEEKKFEEFKRQEDLRRRELERQREEQIRQQDLLRHNTERNEDLTRHNIERREESIKYENDKNEERNRYNEESLARKTQNNFLTNLDLSNKQFNTEQQKLVSKVMSKFNNNIEINQENLQRIGLVFDQIKSTVGLPKDVRDSLTQITSRLQVIEGQVNSANLSVDSLGQLLSLTNESFNQLKSGN